MKRLEMLLKLNEILLADMPQSRRWVTDFPLNIQSQWHLFRSLVNIRKPAQIGGNFIELQDELLKDIISEKGITDVNSLAPVYSNIYLWKGDITTLKIDGIVNAANSGLTGCYYPCHSCIDNTIHTYAGIQLRLECFDIMKRQGYPEPVGRAKITDSYNLPCRNVIHTVGPMVRGRLTRNECEQLKSCYWSCLKLAEEKQLKSIAFCCVSTGEFHFPKKEAAQIVVKTVKEYIKEHNKMKVLFDVFSDEDLSIYSNLI